MQKTFEELALMWSENKQSIVKYSTLCAYRLTLRTHLIPHFGAMIEIEEAEVQRFIIEKIRNGLAKKNGARHCSSVARCGEIWCTLAPM